VHQYPTQVPMPFILLAIKNAGIVYQSISGTYAIHFINDKNAGIVYQSISGTYAIHFISDKKRWNSLSINIRYLCHSFY
jgi:hypothetical protein